MPENVMHLSEAMRLGAMLAPQALYRLHDPDGRTCAFGAALQAVGAEFNAQNIPKLFPVVRYSVDGCCIEPCEFNGRWGCALGCCRGLVTNVWELVAHLNNEHRLTREAIADIVEPIERTLGYWDQKDGGKQQPQRANAGEALPANGSSEEPQQQEPKTGVSR